MQANPTLFLSKASPHRLHHAWCFPLAAMVMLAGCSAVTPNAVAVSPPPAPAPVANSGSEPSAPEPAGMPAPAEHQKTPDPIRQVLAHADRTLRMTPADLTREIARLGEAEDATAETPLLLANALAQTRQPVDTARALGLVQRLLGNPSPAAQALHPLARLMEARLLQQRRLEEQLERQTQQLRDAQRRNDQLNERLEAVRAIERSLTTRPAPAPAPPSPAPASSAPRPAP